MPETLLLEVADVFEIASRGLVLHPSPQMPARGFKPRHCEATLEFPDGSKQRHTIALSPAHFRLLDGGSMRTVEISLDGIEGDIPRGTRVFVDASIARELLG